MAAARFLPLYSLLVLVLLVSTTVLATSPMKIIDDYVAAATLPGIKLTIGQTTFDYVESKVTPALINSLLANLSVPPVNGTQDDVAFAVSNVKVGNVSFSSDQIEFVSENDQGGVSIKISGATAGVTLDWKYTVLYVDLGDSGTATVKVSNIDFYLLVLIGESNGRATVKTGDHSLVLGNLDITLHGGASWFYDFFLSIFRSIIVSEIQNAASNGITQAIDVKLAEILANLPTVVKLPPQDSAQVDISLVDQPAFVNDGSITISTKGMVTPTSGPQNPPYSPVALPSLLNNQMIQVVLGKYTLDTAAWAYYQSGLLSYLVLPNQIPAWFPIQLNTTTWEYLVPELYKEYPNCAMNLHFFVSSVPTIRFNPGTKYKGVAVDVQGDFDVNVVKKNQQVVTVFDLGLDLKLDFVFSFNQSVVHGQFYFVDFNVTIKNSTIGRFDVSIIEFLLNFVVNSLILQPLNAYLASVGVTIPTIQGVTLTTPTITYKDDFVGFTTNLKIVIPSK